MKIPKRFKLLGQTINVEFDETLIFKDDVHGWARYREGTIVLQPSTKDCPIPIDQLEHNFFHELTHHILYAAGEESFDPALHKREFLVDRIAGLLHQAFITAEYEE